MRNVTVFNNLSLDGFFTDAHGDMSWAHEVSDDEWARWSAGNAQGGRGTLLFGRTTYELMAGFWPTEMATQQMPEIAEGMNRMEKLVASRTMKRASWNNTRVLVWNKADRLEPGDADYLTHHGGGFVVSALDRATFGPLLLALERALWQQGKDTPIARTEPVHDHAGS